MRVAGNGSSSRRRIAGGCALLALVASSTSPAAQANIAIQWNTVTLQAIQRVSFAPMYTARALAIVHTCMYDAWAAYDPIAVGTRLGDTLRRPASEHTNAAKEQAISYAAYRCVVDLFPTQKAALIDPFMNAVGFDPLDMSADTTTAAGIGNVAAAAVLAFRHADGSNQLGDLHPGAYSDYTGYAPVNGPDNLSDPNRWQPLRTPGGAVQTFLAPHWGRVIPFALEANAQFRPPPPPLFPQGTYRKQANAILHQSATLDDMAKVIAGYWADGPSTVTPPGHWNVIARFVSERDGHTIDDDVKMFFALDNAMLDASIAAWECKRFYEYVRPISAIRFLYVGKPVRAWGGPYHGAELIPGELFQSYLPTPAFPEYISGHSTFSAAGAEILRLFTGSEAFGGSVTILAGASLIEPGLVPASDVTLSWATFSDAAAEAGLSRRYAGIHFETGDLQGRSLGRRIGAATWAKAQTYFNGIAADPAIWR
jgi:hypothetical protein